MCMRYWLHHIFKNFGHIFHMTRSENVKVGAIVILYLSHVLKIVSQNELIFFCQIVSRAKLLFFGQPSETKTIHMRGRGHLFHKFVHCSPHLFAQGRRCDELVTSTTSSYFTSCHLYCLYFQSEPSLFCNIQCQYHIYCNLLERIRTFRT